MTGTGSDGVYDPRAHGRLWHRKREGTDGLPLYDITHKCTPHGKCTCRPCTTIHTFMIQVTIQGTHMQGAAAAATGQRTTLTNSAHRWEARQPPHGQHGRNWCCTSEAACEEAHHAASCPLTRAAAPPQACDPATLAALLALPDGCLVRPSGMLSSTAGLPGPLEPAGASTI